MGDYPEPRDVCCEDAVAERPSDVNNDVGYLVQPLAAWVFPDRAVVNLEGNVGQRDDGRTACLRFECRLDRELRRTDRSSFDHAVAWLHQHSVVEDVDGDESACTMGGFGVEAVTCFCHP